ncbi:MAG: hypothetical protein PHI23_04350, partial [Candidatus Peribacteraceae bacterium]|nr:hypothetical protein [Candidatus Peribacteraceae bacterium]
MPDRKRRCFVISPIGQEGSETREHADSVYEYIIKPAMETCSIEVFRSDHLREPGRISDQMFREILTDDFCLALLTGHNPNVYYELAVAQAAARPVIILLEKGGVLPFDISDLRCVYYDLKPRPLFEKVYANEIAQHVKSLEAADWRGTPPWGDKGVVGTAGEIEFIERSINFGNPDEWADLLRNTSTSFDTMGISLGKWRKARNFSELLKEKAAAGCAARFLTLHPDNPILKELTNDAIPEMRHNNSPREIADMHAYFKEVAQAAPGA